MTDLTDDQIRVMAAEAMGWVCAGPVEPCWRYPDGSWASLDDLPDPLHDLNDAVALALHLGVDWGIDHKIDRGHGTICGAQEPVAGEYVQEFIQIGDENPALIARALTLAVLGAMEAAK